jgi:hypothetical protein
MELSIAVFLGLSVGAALFGIFYFLNKRYNLDFKYPTYFMLGLAVFFLIMTLSFNPDDVYAKIGYTILSVATSSVIIGYNIVWSIVRRYKK